MSNESPTGIGRETPDRAVLRMAAEDDALQSRIEELKNSGKITDADVDAMIELNARKHNIELSTGRPFSSIETFEDFDVLTAPGEEQQFVPDAEKPFQQGEKYSFNGHEWVYMGIDAESGERVFRREGEGENIEEHRANEEEFAVLFPPAGAESFPQDTSAESHQSATHEPPSAIDAVSEAVADVPVESLEASQKKEAAEQLNALKTEIDEAWAALSENKKRDTPEAKKNYNDAQRTLNQLRLEAESRALNLVGGAFFDPIKLADLVAITRYDEKVGKVSREERAEKEKGSGLSREEIDARYEALRRKDAFIDQLTGEGVQKDVAAYLYHESLQHAKDLMWLQGELEQGETNVLSGLRARHILEWHGVAARESKAVVEAIAPIILDYETLPQKIERPQRESLGEKAEKKRPVDKIFESIALGQEIDDKVLRSFVKDAKTTVSERERLEAELVRREALRKEEIRTNPKPERKRSLGEHVDEVITSGQGDTIPATVLRKFAERPKVAAYLKEHPIPETVISESVASSVNRPPRVTDEMIENAPGIARETTAETRFEIREGSRQNKKSGQEQILSTPIAVTEGQDHFDEQETIARLEGEGGALAPEERVSVVALAEDDGIPVLTEVVDPNADEEGIPTLTEIVEPPLPVELAPAEEASPKKEMPPPNHGVVRQFEQKFGISEGDLQNIEVFNKLSNGQQLLVLKNLEQITLTDIKKEARAEQKEEWGKLPAWKRIWKQSYSFGMNPEHRVAELEKEILAKHRAGVDSNPDHVKILAEHLADLEQLAKVAADGPEVNVGKDGELEMAYFSSVGSWYTPEQKKLIEEFNNAASEFSKFPREWGYEIQGQGLVRQMMEGASKLFDADRRRYAATKIRYAKTRANMLQLKDERIKDLIAGDPTQKREDLEKSALQSMNEVDERIQLNQLFNNHPDAEAALEQIEDQNTIGAAAKEFWSSKGMFIAGGAAVRMTTIAISGGIMFPVIGAIGGLVGAGIGATEGSKLMKARREDGRMSEEDLREEIVVTNKDTGEAIMGADGKPLKRQIKEFTDATFFVDRIDRLSEKLSDTTEPTDRALIEAKIAKTITLMSEKLEHGMINFGGSSLESDDGRKGSTIANRLSFIQAMARGQIDVAVDQDELKRTIERVTQHQSTIEAKRKQEITKIALKSALIRGTFALAGAGIVESVKQIYHFGEPGYFGAVTEVKSGGGNFTPEQVKEVAGAIRNAPNTSGLPDEVVMSGRGVEIKALEEYMTDTNPAHRAQLLETVGMTKEEMEAKIANLLQKGNAGGGNYADAAPDSANPEAFNAANFDKNISDVVGRTPSAEELSVLRLSGGVDDHATANMDEHNALIAAISSSKTPLTHEQLQGILDTKGTVPLAEAADASAEKGGVTEALSYKVASGDNLTHILKENIPELKNLPPQAQENAIQNLLKSLSPEEWQSLGITDPNNLGIDQTIDLNQVVQFLHEKNIGGEDLLTHAAHVTGAPASVLSDAHSAYTPEIAGGVEHNISGTLSAPPVHTAVPWEQLDPIGKAVRAGDLSDHYLAADMSKLFTKSPFEEWPKEWLLSRNRSAIELLNQTQATDPHTLLPGMKDIPAGYEWPIVEKLQKYIQEQGLTSDKGFVPHEKETIEEFIHRALQEKILRDGPSAHLSAVGGVR